MLRASALYIVIIIALVIGIICSSLIAVAYFYRLQYQQAFRHDRLTLNLNSAINILLSGNDTSIVNPKQLDLYEQGTDSVTIQKIDWGLYEVGLARSFQGQDTLYTAFSIGNRIDSTKWCALYLLDEDRPLGLSGKTAITGNAYLPKAGVKTAYINNIFYLGDKRLVNGKQRESERKLPELNKEKIAKLLSIWEAETVISVSLPHSLTHSFLEPVKRLYVGKTFTSLQHIKLKGNIMLISDTTVVIDSTAELENIQVYAQSITINDGFKGTCQLFARDTIGIGKRCEFNYPSCIGLLRSGADDNPLPAKISSGNNLQFSGILFVYEETPAAVRPVINFGSGSNIRGQIYSPGYLQLPEKGIHVSGNVFTGRFLYKTGYSLYENYLVNTILDSKALSPYYLTSDVLSVAGKRKEVLQWLERN